MANRGECKKVKAFLSTDDVGAQVKVTGAMENIVDLLFRVRLVTDKRLARRLIQQGAVRLDGVIVDATTMVPVNSSAVLKIGKSCEMRLGQ